MKANYEIIRENGTVETVFADCEINSNGSLVRFEGETAFVPSNEGIRSIAPKIFNKNEVHCEYFSKSFCSENKLDYDAVNSHFFALLEYKSVVLTDLKIVLKVSGATVDSEFEFIDDYVEDFGVYNNALHYISKVLYKEGPEDFDTGIIFEMCGVEDVYLPSTVKHIADDAFRQCGERLSRLENIHVLPGAEAAWEFGGYFTLDGMLFYYSEDEEYCDRLIKVPAGKKEPVLELPAPLHGSKIIIDDKAFSEAFFVNTININRECIIPPYAFDGVPNLRTVMFSGEGAFSHFEEARFARRNQAAFEAIVPMDAYEIIDYCIMANVPMLFKKQ